MLVYYHAAVSRRVVDQTRRLLILSVAISTNGVVANRCRVGSRGWISIVVASERVASVSVIVKTVVKAVGVVAVSEAVSEVGATKTVVGVAVPIVGAVEAAVVTIIVTKVVSSDARTVAADLQLHAPKLGLGNATGGQDD